MELTKDFEKIWNLEFWQIGNFLFESKENQQILYKNIFNTMLSKLKYSANVLSPLSLFDLQVQYIYYIYI